MINKNKNTKCRSKKKKNIIYNKKLKIIYSIQQLNNSG